MSYNSPSSSMHFRSKQRDKKCIFGVSEKKGIRIETKTSAKKIYIEWSIGKRTIDIAALAPKGEKKGVISSSVEYDINTFNLELCVPGWRRSQDGFSAFYLTVPIDRKNIKKRREIKNETDEDNRNYQDVENEENNNNDDFVAKYTVSFGHNQIITRMSSIRNDFNLGVGFPNFTEIATLIRSIYENELIFKIEIEIFESESVVKKPWIYFEEDNAENIAAKLIQRMYYEKLNCDAVIVTNYLNKQQKEKKKLFKVHKCILTAASPVFDTFFKHKLQGNIPSSIIMNQWNVDIILSMIKFLYLGKIELNHKESLDQDQEDEDYGNYQGLDCFDDLDDLENNNNINNNNNNEEEIKCEEKEDEELINGKPNNIDDEMNNLEFECPEDARKLFGLFQIAECYKIDELLIACCRKLHCYITLKTCCVYLIYLDRYTHLNQVKDIKNAILQFMLENIKSVKNSNGYRYLVRNKPRLLDELIDKITQNK